MHSASDIKMFKSRASYRFIFKRKKKIVTSIMQLGPKSCKMEHLLVTVLLLLLPTHGSGKKAVAQNHSWMHQKRWCRSQLDPCVWWWEMLLMAPAGWKSVSPSEAEESKHIGGFQGRFVGSEPSLQCWAEGGGVQVFLLILEPSCPIGQTGVSLGCWQGDAPLRSGFSCIWC